MENQPKYSEYTEWITSIRRKYDLKQTKFGQRICHFEQKKVKADGKEEIKEVCKFCSRTTISNWENGKNPPLSVETFVSLALVDYCGHCQGVPQALPEERKQRYGYVKQQMKKYLGRSLYSRNLNDILLCAVALGIYGMEEIPDVRARLLEEIKEARMDVNEKKEMALKPMTEKMEEALENVETKENFEQLIRENQKVFNLGYRTLGERMLEIYGKSQHGRDGIEFKQAVALYAPKYIDSHGKMFFVNLSVSRDWLLNFCIHMRFNREDINKTLENASMLKLADEKVGREYYLQETETKEIGSVKWYEQRCVQGLQDYQIRYPEAEALSLQEKFAFLTLTACALLGTDQIVREVPTDYLLEYFLQKEEGKALLKDMRQICTANPDQVQDEPKKCFGDHTGKLNSLLEELKYNMKTEPERLAFEAYREEFSRYLYVPKEKCEKYSGIFAQEDIEKTAKEQAGKLRFFAAVSYSVITGQLYRGQLCERDINRLREELLGEEERRELRMSCRFMEFLWGMFLEPAEKIHWNPKKEGFSLVREMDKKMPKVLGMKEVLEDIAATWWLSEMLEKDA